MEVYLLCSYSCGPAAQTFAAPLRPAYQDRLAETRRVSALTQPAETPCQTVGSVVCQIANKLLEPRADLRPPVFQSSIVSSTETPSPPLVAVV